MTLKGFHGVSSARAALQRRRGGWAPRWSSPRSLLKLVLFSGEAAGASRPGATNQSGSQGVAAAIGDLAQSVYKEVPELTGKREVAVQTGRVSLPGSTQNGASAYDLEMVEGLKKVDRGEVLGTTA